MNKALVKCKDEALWIYYKQAIQCFSCGWWDKATTLELAVELYHKHECEDGKYGKPN